MFLYGTDPNHSGYVVVWLPLECNVSSHGHIKNNYRQDFLLFSLLISNRDKEYNLYKP